MAKSDRPGPVLIDIPIDLQYAKVDTKKLKGFTLPKKKKRNIDKEISDLTKEDIGIIMSYGIETFKLQQYFFSNAVSVEEILKIISIDVGCKDEDSKDSES